MNEQSFQRLIHRIPSTPGFMGTEPLVDYGILIPFVLVKGEYHLLFQKRASGIRQGGEISFPGGRVDWGHDGSPREAAIRETMEELGLASHRVRIEAQMDTFVPGFTSLIHVFIGRLAITSLDELSINRNEVEDVFSVPMSYFMTNPPDMIPMRMIIRPHSDDVQGKKRMESLLREMGVADRYSGEWEYPARVYYWRYGDHVIWGLTADIVVRLLKYLD